MVQDILESLPRERIALAGSVGIMPMGWYPEARLIVAIEEGGDDGEEIDSKA